MKNKVKFSNRTIPFIALALLIAASLSFGSGSVGGGGGISQFGQDYKQGKVIFFQKVACDRAECTVKKSDLNATLAQELVASLRSKDELKAEESPTDKAVANLVGNEVEKVEHYLSRRFRL